MQNKYITTFFFILVSIGFIFLNSCNNDADDFPAIAEDKEILEINVVHHISRDDNGENPTTTISNVNLMMTFLNNNFNQWNIRFVTKEVKPVNNTAWNRGFIRQDDLRSRRDLLPFEDAQSLNIFYFNRLSDRQSDNTLETIDATALRPNEGNNIKLGRAAFEPNNTATLTHEVGHYLGLFNTSENIQDPNGNLELVDGSNATVAGDLIADTPASPVLNETNIDETNCAYIGTETDENGMLYTPDTFNFMTQWTGRGVNNMLCRSRFTPGQVEKMRLVIRNERAILIGLNTEIAKQKNPN